jgi:hypothetical protein
VTRHPFPPETSHEHDIEIMVEALASTIDGPAFYVSAPITSGQRAVDHLRSGEAPTIQAIEANLAYARPIVKKLRSSVEATVIDPTAVGTIDGWSQPDYYVFWKRVMERYVDTVVFVDGWQYSNGCSFEFMVATRLGMRTLDESLERLDVATGHRLICDAIAELKPMSVQTQFLESVAAELGAMTSSEAATIRERTLSGDVASMSNTRANANPTVSVISSPSNGIDIETGLHLKDLVLDRLAEHANVAQFVSFGLDGRQRFSRIRGHSPNHEFASIEGAIGTLLRQTPDGSVNVRSFHPDKPRSREFIYGIVSSFEAAQHVHRLAADGLYTIVNETIDIHDGGVSGVSYGGILEFAPGDTPRCVEKPGTLSLPRDEAIRLIETVYGFSPSLGYESNLRVEFSIHPVRRGFEHDHTIVWELEDAGPVEFNAEATWPNRFSRFVGDKAFGLLMADVLLGLPVPRLTVFARRLPPFSFGQPTGTGETWIRTCPREQAPGKYTTSFGWQDPFALMASEDPGGESIASVLAQEGVAPMYSGAAMASASGQLIVEGVEGRGDAFMQGLAVAAQLPDHVIKSVGETYEQASEWFGPVRLEWVFDGQRIWVVQMHSGATLSSGRTIYPGDADTFHTFDVTLGLEELRNLVDRVAGTGDGILLVGEVGITSHFGDVLREAEIPSRIQTPGVDA